MDYTVESLIKNHPPLITVESKETIKDAMIKMIEHNYSQLPVLDSNGFLAGAVSAQNIARTLSHWSAKNSNGEWLLSDPWLNLTVDHFMIAPAQLNEDESNIFDVMDKLKSAEFVVIVDRVDKLNTVKGIMTASDVNDFFRDFAADLVLVGQIEDQLRDRTKQAFNTDNLMLSALYRAFGGDKNNTIVPSKPEYDKLDFHDEVQVITNDHNWVRFKDVFGPKNAFTNLMARVGEARNKLAHFRGDIDSVQRDALHSAAEFVALGLRREQPSITTIPASPASEDEQSSQDGSTDVPIEEQEIDDNTDADVAGPVMIHTRSYKKWIALHTWLRDAVEPSVDAVRVTFSDIERLAGKELPASAKNHYYNQYWNNTNGRNSNAQIWLSAGWWVANVDPSSQTVTFRRHGNTGALSWLARRNCGSS